MERKKESLRKPSKKKSELHNEGNCVYREKKYLLIGILMKRDKQKKVV